MNNLNKQKKIEDFLKFYQNMTTYLVPWPSLRITGYATFNLIHNRVEYLALCYNDRQVPPKAFQSQYNPRLSKQFYNMFTSTGRHLKYLPLSINREESQLGYSSFIFNLNAVEKSEALSPISSGNFRPKNKFLPNTTNLIVYAYYNSTLEINFKYVLLDYY